SLQKVSFCDNVSALSTKGAKGYGTKALVSTINNHPVRWQPHLARSYPPCTPAAHHHQSTRKTRDQRSLAGSRRQQSHHHQSASKHRGGLRLPRLRPQLLYQLRSSTFRTH